MLSLFSLIKRQMCVFSLIGDMISTKQISKLRILKLRYRTWKKLANETYFGDCPYSLKLFKTETTGKNLFLFLCSLCCFHLFAGFDTGEIVISLRCILQFQAGQLLDCSTHILLFQYLWHNLENKNVWLEDCAPLIRKCRVLLSNL